MTMMQDFWKKLSSGPRPPQALAFLRIATGLYFLYAGLLKYNDPQFASTLTITLKQWVVHNPVAPYRTFLEQFAIPHASELARWVTDGEMAVAISYISGFLISFSAPLAIFLNINFLLAAQHTNLAMLGVNVAFTIISLTLYWGQAGRTFGLDSLFLKQKEQPKPSIFGKSNKKLEKITASLKQAKEAEGNPSRGKKNAKPSRINPF